MSEDWIDKYKQLKIKERKNVSLPKWGDPYKTFKRFGNTNKKKKWDWDEIKKIVKDNNLQKSSDYMNFYVKNKKTLPNIRRIYEKYDSWINFRNYVFSSKITRRFNKKISDEQIIQFMVTFKIKSKEEYNKVRKKYSEILPSANAVARRFGGFKNLKRISNAFDINSIIERFIVLKRELGKRPSKQKCIEYGIEIERGYEKVGGRKKFLEIVKSVEYCMRYIRSKNNEK